MLYPTIIQNLQSTTNTSVQPSQINGGNISQIFNLQAIRKIKGFVNLTTQAVPWTSIVLNQYDGSPITIGANEFIIGYVVGNGNPNNVGLNPSSSVVNYGPLDEFTSVIQVAPYSSLPLTPSNVNVTFSINSNSPTYNSQDNSWTPGSGNGISITPTLVTGDVGYKLNLLTTSTPSAPLINVGYGQLIAGVSNTIQTTAGSLSWLQANISNHAFTIVSPATSAGVIDITLLVLSGTQ
jgi:hypothetical protein